MSLSSLFTDEKSEVIEELVQGHTAGNLPDGPDSTAHILSTGRAAICDFIITLQ